MSQPRTTDAQAFLPDRITLPALREAVHSCRGCALCQNGTRAVFGEGSATARIVLIGEQPGDDEERQGRPFVGPAGRVLRQALQAAAIDVSDVYITNAVKHFKFEERGKRRIHKKPGATEVQACRPWLAAELGLIQPMVIVCLGATAAQAVLGRGYRLTQQHGKFVPHAWAPHVTATLHPSAVLRSPDAAHRREAYSQLVADLKKVHGPLEAHRPTGVALKRKSGK